MNAIKSKYLELNLCFLLVLFTTGSTLAQSTTSTTGLDRTTWYTQDIIDSRIDTHAQNALMHMLGTTGRQAAIASAILSAVLDDGTLQGVYLNSRGVPAQLAQSEGIGWWNIIPKSRQSLCWRTSDSTPPMIVYRKTVTDPQLLRTHLMNAWTECGMAPAVPLPYVATIERPVEEPSEELCLDGGGFSIPCDELIEEEIVEDDLKKTSLPSATRKMCAKRYQRHQLLTACEDEMSAAQTGFLDCMRNLIPDSDDVVELIKKGAGAIVGRELCETKRDGTIRNCKMNVDITRTALIDACVASEKLK